MRYKSPDDLYDQILLFSNTLEIREAQYIWGRADVLCTVTELQGLDQTSPLAGIIAKYQDRYKKFLRREGIETLRRRRTYEQRYVEGFAVPVAALKAELATIEPKDHPDYLGSGNTVDGYKLEKNGEFYAVLIAKPKASVGYEAQDLARGIDGVAQTVAFSRAEQVMISTLQPGQDITQRVDGMAPLIEAEGHMADLLATAADLHARGLVIDPKPSNFLYAPETGVRVVDFSKWNKDLNSLGDQLVSLVQPLMYWNYGYREGLPEAERGAFMVESQIRSLSNIVRLLKLIKRDYHAVLDDLFSKYRIIGSDAQPDKRVTIVWRDDLHLECAKIRALVSKLENII